MVKKAPAVSRCQSLPNVPVKSASRCVTTLKVGSVPRKISATR